MLRRITAALAIFAAIAALVTVPSVITAAPAEAGPADSFSLAKSDNVGGEAVIGEHVTYTLTATGDHASGAYLFNLSFRDVLPAGVSFVFGDPAPTAILSNVPSAGQTTLIWENTSDLPASSNASVSYTVDTNPDFGGGTTGSGTVPVGSTVPNAAEAVASLDAFLIPDWDPGTGAFTGDFDGQASANHSVTIIPFRVTKTGPGELLRGVHDNGFGGRSGSSGDTFTIEIENNPDYATNSVSLVDVLDPELEFLGCDNYYSASDDNSTDVPFRESGAAADEEWAGSGHMATGSGSCDTPTAVDTVDAGLAGGLANTEVTWDLGNLAPGAVITVVYRAGIPMRSNTTSWTTVGGQPAGALDQGHNLDNNSGPSTNELDRTVNADPELLTDGAPLIDNTATASGTYTPTGAIETDTDIAQTEAEDIIIGKSSAGTLNHGAAIANQLTIQTGEYRDFTNLVVRDLLPSALCYTGVFGADNTPGGSDWQSNDCPGAGAGAGSSTSVREIASGGPYGTGRFEIVWDQAGVGGLADLDSDSSITINYGAVVRTDYRGGLTRLTSEPVLAGDSVTNEAEVSGPDFVVTGHSNDGGADDEPGGGVDGDIASAGLSNSLPTINKRVSAKAGPLTTGSNVDGTICDTSYGSITWQDTVATGFGPGEIVCFELGATFPSLVDYENVIIQDLLPPGYNYVAGSAARVTSIDDLPGTTFDATTLRWDLGTVDNPGHEFRWVIAVQLGVPDDGVALDINANLQKMTHNQSGGTVFQYRDEVPAEWTEPQLDLAKGVKTVDAVDNSLDSGPNGVDFDGSTTGGSTSVEVQADAVVTFRVDVTNDGNEPALDAEIWDRLPTGFVCGDVSAITSGGTCSAGVISWTVASIAAGGATELNYDLTVPTDATADESWTNRAGVRTYHSALNADTATDSDANTNAGRYDYYPRNNIDPTVTPNTDTADDDEAFIHTAAPALAKAQASGIDEAGNGSNGTPNTALDRATIGEITEYELSLTIPDGTAVYDAVLTDMLPAGLVYFEGNAAFGGVNQVLAPTITSADTDIDGDDLDGGTFTPPAVGSNGTVTYTLPVDYRNAAGSGDDSLTITFYVQVTTGSAGNTKNNTVAFAWDDAGGAPQTGVNSNTTQLRVVEPSPSVTKTHTVPAGTNVLPGQTITYRIDVANASGASFSVLHDVTVVDAVPVGTTPLQAGAVPVTADGQLVDSTGVSPAGSFIGTWSETNREITWTPSDWAPLVALDPGVTASFTYQTEVDDPATASGTLLNTVDIDGANLAAADPNLADGRTYNRSDTDLVNLPAATIVKDIEPLPADGTDRATVTVGEPLDYDIEINLPTNTRAYDLMLFDQLPNGITFDSFGTPVVSGVCNLIPGPGSLTSGDIELFGPPVGGDGSRIAWFLGDVLANGGTCTVTVPYTVHVDQNAVNADTLDNAATLVWNTTNEIVSQSPPSVPVGYDDPTSGNWDISDGPDVESILVVEPQLELDKDVTLTIGGAIAPCDATPGNNRTGSDDTDTEAGLADGCDVQSGDALRYTLTVTNSGTTGAHDTDVVDTLPSGLEPLANPGGAVAGDGATITGSSGSAGTWDATARTITWVLTGPIASGGGTLTLDYDVQLDVSADLTQGQDLTNTADVGTYFALDSTTRAGISTGDVPTYGNGPSATRGALLPDTVTVEAQFPDFQIVKTSMDDATDARFDQPFEWVIAVQNIGPSADAFNVDITDSLPAGWTYVANSANVTTTFGGPTQVEPTIVGSTLSWADVVSGPSEPLGSTELIAITFDAIPQSSILAPDLATALSNTGTANPHTNAAMVAGEDASGATGCCDTGSGVTSYTDTDTADALIRRVDLEVAKSILDSPPIYFGDTVTYLIEVTNQGPDDATSMTLTDVFAPGHTYLSTVNIDTGTFTPSTSSWDIGDLASGTTVELRVQLEVNAAGTVTNTAQITTAGQWDIDSIPDNDIEAEDDQETVTITALDTDLGNRVWLDLNADGVQDGSEPGIGGVDVYVSWTDADSVLQVRSTTTDADGNWNVAGLPVGTALTVTVDPSNPTIPAGTGGGGSTLPGGVAPTWELADNPVITNPQAGNGHTTSLDHETSGIVLTAANNMYVDVDFGYVGINSVGDEVWFDADAGGESAPETGDVALVGVNMTLTWAGVDGVFGNADDLVLTDTTDASGNYLFGGLPDGQYRVTVDNTTLPGGATPTFDLDGVSTVDSSGDFDLGVGQLAAEDRTDVDFAYTATGSLGDTVWVDANRDGVLDTGEAPLAGIAVTATFTLPGGLVVNLQTTTAVDGTYQFTGLPLDLPITVTVDDTTLPTGLIETFDLDGTGTAHTAVATLTAAQPDRTDVDFGYAGDGEIGDLVWLDLDAGATATQDAGEPGLEGVTVTLTWTNPTGGADMVLTTTTDSLGAYLFGNLPPGDYAVAVSDLPAGTTPTFDNDGGADLTSSLTLALSESNLDQDFSVAGTGSLGDTVWRDSDNDGVFDTDEDPLPGVQVQVTWTDPASASTYTWTETTDASGNYSVAGLPAGSYTVTIVPSTLPAGYAPTFDLDGGDDGTATLTLGAGEDRTDVDFGYRPEADLVIIKTHTGDFRIGEDNDWDITVRNDGDGLALAPVTVTDALPSAVDFVSAGGDDWACTETSGTVTCTYASSTGSPIDMAHGASSDLTITVEPTRDAAPSVTNTATVASPTADPDLDNNSSSDPTEVPLALLELSKDLDGNLRANENAVYTLTVTNTGPSPTNGTISVTDILPTGLTYVSASAPTGVSCTDSGQLVTCERDSSLAVDATFAVDVTVKVVATNGAAINNVATVTGGNEVNGAALSPTEVAGLTQTATEAATVGASTLPFTGTNAGRLLWLAAILITLGVALGGTGKSGLLLRSRHSRRRRAPGESRPS